MFDSAENVAALAQEYQQKSPKEILALALDYFGENMAISFSGAEDVLLIDLAAKLGKPFRVFTLDTGRLHPETYALFDQVRERYNVDIETCFPDFKAVSELTSKKGFFSFYQDGHQECCQIRKVKPLKEKLSTLNAWVTGQRKDQSPNTRAEIPVIQWDAGFSGPDKNLIKFNPLANWTSKQVWYAIRDNQIPYNKLHERGFVSIGCEPCTKAILPSQHEREGRWWWEEATKKECGLHAVNLES
jgi:phosphoadenosine phosphosulfate reductase